MLYQTTLGLSDSACPLLSFVGGGCCSLTPILACAVPVSFQLNRDVTVPSHIYLENRCLVNICM